MEPPLPDARERKASELAKREALYGAFITEAIRVALEALEREIDSLNSVSTLFALLNRIRLTASADSAGHGEATWTRSRNVHGRQQDTAASIRRLQKPGTRLKTR